MSERADTAAEAFVDPAWVAEHLDEPTVCVIEVDVSPAAYEQGHVPGAVLWDAYADLRHPDYTPIGPDELASLLAATGVTPETTIVFYGYAAPLGFWLMKSHGHGLVRLMTGGREGWEESGMRWSADVPTPARASYPTPSPDPRLIASLEAVQDAIGDPRIQIVDVRSRAEFEGENFWPSGATEGAGRSGRVPGAVHVPVDALRSEGGGLKDAEEIRGILAECAVDPDRHLLLYCTIGNRAGEVWFALKQMLGYQEASVYYGSWAEWGSLAETPVESSGRGR